MAQTSLRICVGLVILILVAPAFAQQEQILTVQPWIEYDKCRGCYGWRADPGEGMPPYVANCQFQDPLPSGAVVRSVTVTWPLGNHARYTWQGVPSVTTSLAGNPLGGTTTVTNLLALAQNCPPLDYTFPSDTFPGGLPGYVYGGQNTFTATVTGGDLYHNTPSITFRYIISVEAFVDSGNNQIGVVGSPLQQKLIAKLTGPAGFMLGGKKIKFSIKTQPSNNAGATIGADDTATTTTYDALTDVFGRASAVLVLGSAAGTYAVDALSELTVTNVPAQFTATAKKPDSIKIARDRATLSSVKPSYTIPLLKTATFHALGVDASGQLIGPVKCDWSAPGKGKNAASGTVSPDSASTKTDLTPSALGTLQIVANPKISGIPTVKVDALITDVYMQIGPTFNASSPEDESPKFIPGSDLDGKSLALPSPADGTKEIQTITLHLITDPGLKGTVKYELTNVSSYPGIAMNWPVTNPGTSKDLAFDGGAQATPAQAFDPTGDTATKLHVYDYGARGELNVTITTTSGQQKQFTFKKTLPANTEKGMLYPDAGWYALANASSGTVTHIPNTTAAADADSDPTPAAQSVTLTINGAPVTYNQGLTGDGLSLYEEYRGFVVNEKHRRLNPNRKDLFVLMDADLQSLDGTFQTLPLTFHYIRSEEAVIDGQGLHPRINPSSMGVPGTSPQHGLRIRWRTQAPTLTWANGATAPAYVEWFGKHFGMNENLQQVTNPDPNLNGDPNQTRVVDIFAQAFGKSAIFAGPNLIIESLPACTNFNQMGCDELDLTFQAVYPGIDRVLNTTPVADDHYEEIFNDCNGVRGFYSADQLDPFKEHVLAHEAVHGLNVNHADAFPNLVPNPCGRLLYSAVVIPPATSYESLDIIQLRLHQKHP